MRILFHYTHKQTFGHTTRCFSFANALSSRGAEVLILHGGIPQPFIRSPKGCKIVDIPHPFDSRNSFQSHAKPVSAEQRTDFILKTATDFNPDVFITEFFPFGRMDYAPELLPTLRHLRKKGTRIIASIGYPLVANLEHFKDQRFAAFKRALFAFFDTFLIHTPPELETQYFKETIQPTTLSNSYTSIMESLKKRIIYTGYIFPDKMVTGGTPLPATKASNTIIVSRGGGSVYPKLITSAIEAQRHLDGKICTIISCGPATSSKEKAFFQSRLQPQDKGRVFLADYLDNLHDHLRTCRVFVGLCGYNTSVQLMRYGTPSVIIPYQNKLSTIPTNNDQLPRSRLLQEKFSSIVLDCHTMTRQSLATAIKEQLSRPRPAPAPADWFNGADVAAQAVVQDTPN